MKQEKKAVVTEIEDTLDTMQAIVGGYIDVTYPFPDPVGIILNDEGIYNDACLPNRFIAQEGTISGILCGTFIVAGLYKENFRSLTEKEMEYYLHYYNEDNGPQFYIQAGEKSKDTAIKVFCLKIGRLFSIVILRITKKKVCFSQQRMLYFRDMKDMKRRMKYE